MSAVRIDLLRHGEPEGGRRYRGHGVDDPLSVRGWDQMWRAVGDATQWTRIVSSPLARCRAFAEALASARGIPCRIDVRLREVGFGVWEGRSPAEIEREDPEGYAAFRRDPVGHRPEGAESLECFNARVVAAFDDVVASGQGQRVLIVAHAGVVRAIAAACLQAPIGSIYRMRVAYATYVNIDIEDDGSGLVTGINRERPAP